MYKDPIFLTPDSDSWDPYSNHFTDNEESMLDWEGNIQPKHNRTSHVLNWTEDVDDNDYENAVDFTTVSVFQALDPTSTSPSIINHEFMDFAAALGAHVESSKFSPAIGSTVTHID